MRIDEAARWYSIVPFFVTWVAFLAAIKGGAPGWGVALLFGMSIGATILLLKSFSKED